MYVFKPIECWPGEPTKNRQRSRFQSSWSETLDLLDRELRQLRAKNVILQADCDESQIRLDGQLRASARLRGPGVILSFESMHGPLSYPCDRFDDWQDNVRAIALALEALRKVNRYGVTRNAEQYKGWKRLGSDGEVVYSWTSAAEAYQFIFNSAGQRVGVDVVAAWKAAAKKYHPDVNPSGNATFKRLVSAREYLKQEGRFQDQ